MPTGHQWLITRFGKLASPALGKLAVTVSASDLGQTLSGGKFRNGSSRFKATQTDGVRAASFIDFCEAFLPNEEKSIRGGSNGCVDFPK